MSFVSLEFFVLFSVTVPLYFMVPSKLRIAYLLVISCVFYSVGSISYLLLLFLSTTVDYFLARVMAPAQEPRRRTYLILSLAVNLGTLGAFKYFDFFARSVNSLHLPVIIGELSWLMPIGLSFYTFAKIGYIVDVYRGRQKPEENFALFAAFVSFFPNLAAGPIERAGHLIPQLRSLKSFDENRLTHSLMLILLGLFKKVVIADHLAIYVNQVFNQPYQYSGLVLLTAVIFLSFQIYTDFSGYTDIARGIALLFGIELFQNFRQPYFALTVQDFWRRWHMSLTNWIREFLFFPLARFLLKATNRRYPRVAEASTYLIVMTLIGLWHGANWTFVIWGMLHGLYMVIETLSNMLHIRVFPTHRWGMIAKGVFVFSLVSFAWIFFRANSLSDVGYIVSHMFHFAAQDDSLRQSFQIYLSRFNSIELEILVCFGLILGTMVLDWIESKWGLVALIQRTPLLVRWAIYYTAIVSIYLAMSSVTSSQQFIYFQF
ncbi:MAG: MBOAT family protein [Anaerolinea sp.]|nr:MBOAT family protein [Anaerolinea sp.]